MEKQYIITLNKDFKALMFAKNNKEAIIKFKEYVNEEDGLFNGDLYELNKNIAGIRITNNKEE